VPVYADPRPALLTEEAGRSITRQAHWA